MQFAKYLGNLLNDNVHVDKITQQNDCGEAIKVTKY